MQTIPERVNALITHSGAARCDRCIQEALDLAQNNQVQQITSALATTSEFVREKAPCASCRKVKAVTRRVMREAA
jgi:cellobiose-specific phosphotransferase system component IIA